MLSRYHHKLAIIIHQYSHRNLNLIRPVEISISTGHRFTTRSKIVKNRIKPEQCWCREVCSPVQHARSPSDFAISTGTRPSFRLDQGRQVHRPVLVNHLRKHQWYMNLFQLTSPLQNDKANLVLDLFKQKLAELEN